jgi:nicotinamide riboside kinase
MAKRMEKTTTKPVRIILTGPESTGKTLLSEELAIEYKGALVAEYARDYMLNLNRPYTYDDVYAIARKQVEEMEHSLTTGERMVFYDTYLIITKVWFEVVFNEVPEWIDSELAKTVDALYLLCKPDIPWVPDILRENGGEMRNVLYHRYLEELNRAGLKYACVEGFGKDRVECARYQINLFLRNNE